ncbi:efflux RND transporter periplasmic adaptor subunit [Thermosulfuriphilus sp.]
MKKSVVTVLLVASLAALIIFLDSEPEKKRFQTAEVDQGPIVVRVTATGTVNPVTLVRVGSQVTGTIKEIYVDFNSRVRKGEVIARIDPALFEAEVKRTEAAHQAALADLQGAQATLFEAERNYQRQKTLLQKDFISQADLDRAYRDLVAAQAKVKIAKARVLETKAAFDRARANLSYTIITSPVDGIVISRDVDVGQTVVASLQAPSLFVIAQDLTRMQVQADIDEADIGQLKEGLQANFTVDAYPDEVFQGIISQIRYAPKIIQNVVTYEVIILVDNPELKLRPGMTANVSIVVQKKENALRLPNAALHFRPEGLTAPLSREGSVVWKLGPSGLKPVVIKIGLSDDRYTEILKVLNGNLKVGDQVVIQSIKKAKNKRRPLHRRLRF